MTMEPALTLRETEVVQLVAEGRTNSEIAEALHLSPWTVKRHVARLLRKTGHHRRVELALWFASQATRSPQTVIERTPG
jgi:DNA-binding CsgD family transcriptional regulator